MVISQMVYLSNIYLKPNDEWVEYVDLFQVHVFQVHVLFLTRYFQSSD